MKKLEGIWKFLNSRLVGYALIIILAIFIIGTCKRASLLRDDLNRQNNNVEALADTIKHHRTNNGELRASILGYIANVEELRLFNTELSDQVKNERGRVITLNNIVFSLRQDTAQLRLHIDSLLTVMNEPIAINDSTWRIDWNIAYTYDANNYDRYSGSTIIGLMGDRDLLKDIKLNHQGTILLNRDSQIKMTWGQTEVDGRLRVYAQTAHPAFKAQLLEGVYVDYPSRRQWFSGFGVGPQLGMGWNFIRSEPTFYIGVGVYYSIYSF